MSAHPTNSTILPPPHKSEKTPKSGPPPTPNHHLKMPPYDKTPVSTPQSPSNTWYDIKKQHKRGQKRATRMASLAPLSPQVASITHMFDCISSLDESYIYSTRGKPRDTRQTTPSRGHNSRDEAILPPTPSTQQISTPPRQVSGPRPRNHRDSRERA